MRTSIAHLVLALLNLTDILHAHMRLKFTRVKTEIISNIQCKDFEKSSKEYL